eukprot:CAMPEP_0173455728 /NCGR_PEP_ID=MMETSP1357-20121228/54793_1 /TAXON_ID=77926 /ORGANISM="Hemiselmis rufescens, Strain PCC563" /LENGTH=117 /DNA_ID=CAMNT_0014422887 /DNA_START=229 /DNA_END=579 /DNA_ORIENTATION=+
MGHTPLDVAECYGHGQGESGRLLREAGGTLTSSDWYREWSKDEAQMVEQRKRITIESKGKMDEIKPSFRPEGYSLTVAMATRDTMDPNRHGHKKRSMMDSTDLLSFRQTQMERAEAP